MLAILRHKEELTEHTFKYDAIRKLAAKKKTLIKGSKPRSNGHHFAWQLSDSEVRNGVSSYNQSL
jgi:hypothetical protein